MHLLREFVMPGRIKKFMQTNVLTHSVNSDCGICFRISPRRGNSLSNMIWSSAAMEIERAAKLSGASLVISCKRISTAMAIYIYVFSISAKQFEQRFSFHRLVSYRILGFLLVQCCMPFSSSFTHQCVCNQGSCDFLTTAHFPLRGQRAREKKERLMRRKYCGRYCT